MHLGCGRPIDHRHRVVSLVGYVGLAGEGVDGYGIRVQSQRNRGGTVVSPVDHRHGAVPIGGGVAGALAAINDVDLVADRVDGDGARVWTDVNRSCAVGRPVDHRHGVAVVTVVDDVDLVGGRVDRQGKGV